MTWQDKNLTKGMNWQNPSTKRNPRAKQYNILYTSRNHVNEYRFVLFNFVQIAVEENEFRQLCALDQLNERKSEAGPERSLSQLVSFSTLRLILLFFVPLAAIIFATMKK